MLKHPAILERVINRDLADFSPELARHILSLDFPAADHERYAELSAKASDGTLSDEERSELEDYLNFNDFLMIIKTKSRDVAPSALACCLTRSNGQAAGTTRA